MGLSRRLSRSSLYSPDVNKLDERLSLTARDIFSDAGKSNLNQILKISILYSGKCLSNIGFLFIEYSRENNDLQILVMILNRRWMAMRSQEKTK